jgi:hypothetical protein
MLILVRRAEICNTLIVSTLASCQKLPATVPDLANRPRQLVFLTPQIRQLAQGAIYGSLSETYRRCGNPDCRCHHGGPKHGPHLYISYRGTTGKTTGYYVPQALEAQIRQGVDAWSQLQDCLRELAALNKERLIPAKAKK